MTPRSSQKGPFSPKNTSIRLLNGEGTNFDSTSAFTVSTWIKPDESDVDDTTKDYEHYAVWYTNPQGQRAFMVSIRNGNWYASIGDQRIEGPQAHANQWTHVGIAYDGHGRANLYVDQTDTQSQNTDVKPAQGLNFGIGWGGTTWSGAIDLTTIYTTYQEQSQFRTLDHCNA